MSGKPKDPYPPFAKRILRKIIPNHIYRRYVGRHDDESMRLWAKAAMNVSQGKAILDIGAFTGSYAQVARNVNSKTAIYAFEPNPDSAETLRKNCASKNISVVELAIAEANRSVSFLLNSQVSRIWDPTYPATERTVQVAAMSLDSWATQNNVIPSLIKMDTEGTEADILRGGQHLLAECRPIMLCEILSDLAGHEVEAALPENYIYFYIEENTGIIERQKITRKVWRNNNWLLVPKERVSEMCT
jgi:FkbM family methyltransferase